MNSVFVIEVTECPILQNIFPNFIITNNNRFYLIVTNETVWNLQNVGQYVPLTVPRPRDTCEEGARQKSKPRSLFQDVRAMLSSLDIDSKLGILSSWNQVLPPIYQGYQTTSAQSHPELICTGDALCMTWIVTVIYSLNRTRIKFHPPSDTQRCLNHHSEVRQQSFYHLWMTWQQPFGVSIITIPVRNKCSYRSARGRTAGQDTSHGKQKYIFIQMKFICFYNVYTYL